MNSPKKLNKVRERRKSRTRARITGTAERPRLSVFRSNHGMIAQAIDDAKSVTVFAVYSRELDGSLSKKSKTEQAGALGEIVVKKAQAAKVSALVFDRRGYAYHGRVKALAEAVRKGGIEI
ncbi:MAG: 50S ribosomal protein L18 [Candidatus Liptonbacteria bacterium]